MDLLNFRIEVHGCVERFHIFYNQNGILDVILKKSREIKQRLQILNFNPFMNKHQQKGNKDEQEKEDSFQFDSQCEDRYGKLTGRYYERVYPKKNYDGFPRLSQYPSYHDINRPSNYTETELSSSKRADAIQNSTLRPDSGLQNHYLQQFPISPSNVETSRQSQPEVPTYSRKSLSRQSLTSRPSQGNTYKSLIKKLNEGNKNSQAENLPEVKEFSFTQKNKIQNSQSNTKIWKKLEPKVLNPDQYTTYEDIDQPKRSRQQKQSDLFENIKPLQMQDKKRITEDEMIQSITEANEKKDSCKQVPFSKVDYSIEAEEYIEKQIQKQEKQRRNKEKDNKKNKKKTKKRVQKKIIPRFTSKTKSKSKSKLKKQKKSRQKEKERIQKKQSHEQYENTLKRLNDLKIQKDSSHEKLGRYQKRRRMKPQAYWKNEKACYAGNKLIGRIDKQMFIKLIRAKENTESIISSQENFQSGKIEALIRIPSHSTFEAYGFEDSQNILKVRSMEKSSEGIYFKDDFRYERLTNENQVEIPPFRQFQILNQINRQIRIQMKYLPK